MMFLKKLAMMMVMVIIWLKYCWAVAPPTQMTPRMVVVVVVGVHHSSSMAGVIWILASDAICRTLPKVFKYSDDNVECCQSRKQKTG